MSSRALNEVGLDSNCLSYLIDALEGVGPPAGALAAQKVALVRLFLYTEGALWAPPTVRTEFLRITNDARRESHQSWTNVLFGVRPLASPAEVERRVQELMSAHAAPNDCRILAEAEDIGLATLLTFDGAFISRLAEIPKKVELARPAELWSRLGLPAGMPPVKVPTFGNPLASEAWWRW